MITADSAPLQVTAITVRESCISPGQREATIFRTMITVAWSELVAGWRRSSARGSRDGETLVTVYEQFRYKVNLQNIAKRPKRLRDGSSIGKQWRHAGEKGKLF